MSETINLFSTLGIPSESVSRETFASIKKLYFRKLEKLHQLGGKGEEIALLTKGFTDLRTTLFPAGNPAAGQQNNIVSFPQSGSPIKINATHIGLGGALTLVGTQFISHANGRVRQKIADNKSVTFADRLYQGAAFAGTTVAAVITAALGITAFHERSR